MVYMTLSNMCARVFVHGNEMVMCCSCSARRLDASLERLPVITAAVACKLKVCSHSSCNQVVD